MIRIFVVLCFGIAVVSRSIAANDRASEVCSLIASCQNWENLKSNDAAGREAITETYLKVSSVSTEDVRKGVQLYLNSNSTDLLKELEAQAKLYGLFRVFFRIEPGFYQVASWYDKDSRGLRAQSFWGSPWRSGKVDLLWPFSMTRDHQFVLVGIGMGEKSGTMYEPLPDFENLLKKFGRRFK